MISRSLGSLATIFKLHHIILLYCLCNGLLVVWMQPTEAEDEAKKEKGALNVMSLDWRELKLLRYFYH